SRLSSATRAGVRVGPVEVAHHGIHRAGLDDCVQVDVAMIDLYGTYVDDARDARRGGPHNDHFSCRVSNCAPLIRLAYPSKSAPPPILAEMEEHFLVVYWKQRGAGRSSRRGLPRDSMTIDR